MTEQLTPENFLEALKKAKMTPEERAIADAEKAGEAPTVIWLALVYLVGFQVAWVKVFGAYFIFNFIKNIVKSSFKND